MTHLFRPADPPDHPSPPVGPPERDRPPKTAGQWLAPLASVGRSQRVRVALHTCLILLGLILQGALLLTAGYLIDLSVSLMELWADLARKHLELTL